MSDLLPCPFCGGEAVKVDGFTVACAHGLCIGWTVRRASPHEWNTRALPAVQPDAEWQPIETAPKDRVIDLWSVDGERYPDAVWGVCGDTEGWTDANDHGSLGGGMFTHWRSRPAPPAVQPDAALLEAACIAAHDAYEAAAHEAGWATNPQSRKPWIEVPEANKVAMRAGIGAAFALFNTPTGKEVMPDVSDANSTHQSDTAPAGLSAGGGAEIVSRMAWAGHNQCHSRRAARRCSITSAS